MSALLPSDRIAPRPYAAEHTGMTVKELALRRDHIEDMNDARPGEHRAILLELERRSLIPNGKGRMVKLTGYPEDPKLAQAIVDWENENGYKYN